MISRLIISILCLGFTFMWILANDGIMSCIGGAVTILAFTDLWEAVGRHFQAEDAGGDIWIEKGGQK